MRLIFVRHGQTISNTEFRYQGHKDSSLNELGLLQAATTAESLKREDIRAVYSSDLSRAVKTAEIIAEKHSLPVVTDSRLRECGFGDWEGLTAVEIQAKYPDLFTNYRRDSIKYRAPNGERLDSMYDRVVAAVYELVECHASDTVVVVTHGGPIHAFLCHALETDLTMFRRARASNGGITILISQPDGKWFLKILNQTSHLRGLQLASLDESSSESPRYWNADATKDHS